MSKPFDAVPKYLLTTQPTSWVRWLGIRTKRVKLCNVDLSTVSSAADALLLIGYGQREALHLEIQSRYDEHSDNRMLEYNVLGTKALKVPVRSVMILLRPAASGPGINGRVRRQLGNGNCYLEFCYEVVRVWERKPEEFFTSGVGVLPLAFLSNFKPERLPELVEQAKVRLQAVKVKERREIWTAIDVLMGMRYDRAAVERLLKGVKDMEESTTYQAIIEKGEQRGIQKGISKGISIGKRNEAREVLLKLGSKHLGSPDPKTLNTLNKINSRAELERLIERTFAVSSWNALLSRRR